MRTDSTAPLMRPPAVSRDGVLFLYSPNLGIRVRYGSLAVDLGRGRTLTVDRASEPRLRRLVLCGRAGWWTFEVPAWLRGIGASWMHLDLMGRILGQGPGDVSPNLPALRRAQAGAAGSEVGLSISRDLLGSKLAGQATNLSPLPGADEAEGVALEAMGDLARCSTADALRIVEARAANAWWSALSDLPVNFAPADEPKVPEGWLRVGRRGSQVTGAPRGASSPAHAAWNFAYACAAGEVDVNLRAVGLDPGISPTGLHTDTPARSSATCDVLEAIRGDVDRLMLGMILGRRFRRRDFVQQPDGRVRLTAPLARELAEAVMPLARQAVGPVAEGLARTLAGAASGAPSQMPPLPMNLTGDARSRGRDGIRRGDRRMRDTSERVARALLPPACRRCGIVFDDPADRERKVCDECFALLRAEQVPDFARSGYAAVAKLRAQGRDPMNRPETRRKVAASQSHRIAADREWERTHPGPRPGPETFERDVLPGVQGVSLAKLATATGLSLQHCGKIRRGLYVPHPRHWEALREIVATSSGTNQVS